MAAAALAPEPAIDGELLKQAMRRLVGGVVVITAGTGEDRVGLTATSAVSLSVDPPTMLICVNRASSTWPVIARRHFCVSILGAGQQATAERFAGIGGLRGAARYRGADWTIMESGASGLTEAQAIVDCALEEVIERHSHAILLGAVRAVRLNRIERPSLAYGGGRFIGISPHEAARGTGRIHSAADNKTD